MSTVAMETAGIRAAAWVVGKALSPLSGGVLEAWAASTKLGSNIEALKLALLEAQGMLNSAQGKVIHNPALAELLDKLRQLAYRADDVLDELDYFRIQDELDGTYHAADEHAAGWAQDLVLNARHTARACVNKLKFPATRRDDPDNGAKQGCLRGIRSCGRREIRSSPPSPGNQLAVQKAHNGCMPQAAHNVGKHFSCFSLQSDDHDAQTDAIEIPKLKFDRVEMSTKILEILDQFKPICVTVSRVLNLELLNCSHIPAQDIATNRPKTTPQIIEPKLYGRDSQKKIIIDEIFNGECSKLTVLPIVGPGGIGKTTFTQHIYEQMKSHFQVHIWICVSLDLSANRLAKDIVEKIPQVDHERKNCSDEELIEQRIGGKRVLLVLDDVWKHHENEWKKLLALFKKEGAKGNTVIVTTRIPEVANMVKTTKCSLELERLSPVDIMSFFEECVFDDQDPWVGHLELSDIGSKIVDKLKGSPLATRTVGRLLRNKLTLNHWKSVLESKEWELQTDENDIMPALKLSYDYLPFRLQQCFSFCSLFPEDYEFDSEELVHLWIGLDILQSCDQKKRRIEDVGMCYLNDLVNHGFFKMNEKEDKHPYYVIHDLLHELAVKVSSYECLSICSSNVRDIQISQSVRHLSIIVDNTDVDDTMSFNDYAGNLTALGKRLKVENLHTVMLFGDYHGSFAKKFGGLFSEARALRIISLSNISYNVEDIFHNFSKLVHLRYLRIKSVYYWKLSLPSALFRLYHLEVIDLQSQYGLPSVHKRNLVMKNVSNLVKLRYFLVSKCPFLLHSHIFGVGKLKLLQELKEFSVGMESEGFEASQLGQLTDIGGSLGISNLEKVQTKEEASELKLIHKKHLRELILKWDIERSNRDHVQEGNILESLVPHSDLQGLHIEGHGGSSCPTWLCTDLSVKCLESLCLDGVSWKNLPPLGEMWMINEHGEEYQGCSTSPPSFHNLKRLQLSNISCLTKWIGSGACPIFSHLEVLIVTNCCDLIELPLSHPTCCQAQREDKMAWFPRLGRLVILNCPKLASLPPIPWRARGPCSAGVAGSGFERLVYSSKFRSGISLEVEGKGGQGDVLWNLLNFSNLTDLKHLTMVKCPPLPLEDFRRLACLKTIMIYGSSSVLPPVEGAGHGIYHFPCEDLEIRRCDVSGKELTLLLSFLPNLSKLNIKECEKITGLGVVEHAGTVYEEQQQQTTAEEEIITAAEAQGLLLLPPQLQKLSISSCKNMSLLPNPLHDGRVGGLQRLRSLRFLFVAGCPDFLFSYSSSSSSFFPFPTCLQHLTLWDVKHMETLQALSNLTSLTKLHLAQMRVSRDEGLWPLLAHGCLTELALFTDSDFFAVSDPSRLDDREVFSSFSKLLHLETRHTGFLGAPICSLFSSTLTILNLCFDAEVKSLTKEQEEALQLFTSLQHLSIRKGYELQRLPARIHKLMNLKKLTIYACSAIQSLPSLPSSLQELKIENCGAIKLLPNSLPSSLKKLEISDCNAIKSLPKDGLPSSMQLLDVHDDGNSEELKRECCKLMGIIPIVRT